jgi:erythritol transport system substrate-binding protein
VLQPVAVFSREAVIQADHYIQNGSPLVSEEKQLFDCLLITPDNVEKYTAAFTLSD